MTRDNEPQIADIHRAITLLQGLSDSFVLCRQQLAKADGITEQQWRVLEEISTEHFIPSMFARQQDSSAAAVSKLLRQLQDKDLVERSPSIEDGRTRRYQLSKSGLAVMHKLREQRQIAIREVWAKLPPQIIVDFLSSGEVIHHAVAQLAEQYSTKR